MKKSTLCIALICVATVMCSCSSNTNVGLNERDYDIYYSGYIEGYQDAVETLQYGARSLDDYLNRDELVGYIYSYFKTHEVLDEYTILDRIVYDQCETYSTEEILNQIIDDYINREYYYAEKKNLIY